MYFPKRLLWMLCFLFSTTFAFSQKQTVKGTVADNNNTPLAGVTVEVKGEKTFTTTDANGKFSIALDNPSKAVLVLSYVGFEKQEMAVSGKSDLPVSLKPLTGNLGEIVVVGYGTQKRANLTGAVSTVKADAFKDRPITNASQVLAGQAPGVWVNQASGQPGADGATIRIRGIGTLGNSNPLILVDGIVSSFNSINPNDIESVTVLKDAASSAIYGSRAANGVVLVQTKKGKKGPLQVDLHSYWGTQKPALLPEMVSNSVEFMNLFNTALANEGSPAHFAQGTIDEYKNGNDPLIYPNNDWVNIIIKPASMQEHVVTLSGGKDETQYSTSLGYLDQDGVVRNDNFKRYSARFNLASKVSDRFDWGLTTTLLNGKTRMTSYQTGSGVPRELLRSLPFHGTYTADGKYASTWVNAVNPSFNNPLAFTGEGLNRNTSNSILGSVYFNLQILKGLKWNVTGGLDHKDNLFEYFTPDIGMYDPKSGALKNKMGNGQRSLTNNYNKSLLTTFYTTLTYRKVFLKDHEVTVLGGFNQEKYTDKFINGYIEGFLSNSLTELNAGASNKNVAGGGSDYGIRSLFGRLNYGFKGRYFAEANLRYDGSSRFSEDNRWGLFPSFSAGWRISEESFMQNQNIFSNLKLRGSWGKLGNDQIGLYAWIPSLSSGADYYFNGTVSGGVAQTSMANPAITWETAKKSDIGLEAGFMKNKLNIEVDYFNEVREDILRNISMPWTVGALTPPTVNLATVKNTGWEFNANYTSTIGGVRFNTGFNVTHVTNEVVTIPDPQIGFNILKEGETINAFYMWKALGIFQNQAEVDASPKPVGRTTKPGDIKFEDISGPAGKADGIITADDRQVVGKPVPTWTYGFNFNVDYKGFDLGLLLQGMADVESYAYGDEFIPFFNGAGVTQKWTSGNTWTPNNPNAKLPRLLQNSAPTWNYSQNSFWLQDASYMRIKNIQLGYTLPQNLVKRIFAKSIRFYLNAQNPFTFTKFENLDPERVLTSTSSAQYPNVKIFTGGVNIRF